MVLNNEISNMKSLKTPIRPAPSVEESRFLRNSSNVLKSHSNNVQQKKKPPPRPPPPKFNKVLSSITPNENLLLMDFSPPSSPTPKVKATSAFGGSCSSSGSFSTSSISSKSSIESEVLPPFTSNASPSLTGPTIIRAQPSKRNTKLGNNDPSTSVRRNGSESPPMPTTKPPSPPPYGIALYDYMGTHIDDLTLQINDIVFLIRRIGNEWYYGKVDDREGMFPANYIDVQVPLPPEGGVIAIYSFPAETPYDLPLVPGQSVTILYRISNEWLYGESNGRKGQFPANFINYIPSGL